MLIRLCVNPKSTLSLSVEDAHINIDHIFLNIVSELICILCLLIGCLRCRSRVYIKSAVYCNILFCPRPFIAHLITTRLTWWILADADPFAGVTLWDCIAIIVKPELPSIVEVAMWRPIRCTLLRSHSDCETQLSGSLFAFTLWWYPFASGSTHNPGVLYVDINS